MLKINRRVCWGMVLCLLVAVGGCAQRQFKRGSTWTPTPRQAPPPPPVKNMPISPELEARAAEELGRAVSSDQPLIRAHAIEALTRIGGEGIEDAIVQALHDPAGIVRFAGVMAAGERRVAAALPRLRDMVEDSSLSVQVAVRFALHRLGDYTHSRDLETFATHPQAPVRANTALVLGLLGEPTGLNILRGMQRDRDPAVLLQVAEARWRLGDMEGLEKLVAASQSAYPDYQMIAAPAIAGPRDQRVIEHVRAMLTAEHTEVQLAAARAMGMLGSDEGYVIAANAARQSDPRLQLLAAVAFAEIGRNDAQAYLEPLLSAQDPDVRLAAAAAIMRLAQR